MCRGAVIWPPRGSWPGAPVRHEGQIATSLHRALRAFRPDLPTVGRAHLNRSAQKSQRPKISGARKISGPEKKGWNLAQSATLRHSAKDPLSFTGLLGPSGPIWRLATAHVMARSARCGHSAHEARRAQSAKAHGLARRAHRACGTEPVRNRAHTGLLGREPDLACLAVQTGLADRAFGEQTCLGAKREKSRPQKNFGPSARNSHSEKRSSSAPQNAVSAIG